MIAPDGTAYFFGADKIYAFKEGQVKWTVPISGLCQGLALDGTIYVQSFTDYKLHALDPAGGATKWTYDGGLKAIGPDATLYIGNSSGWLHAVTPAGKWKWTYPSFPVNLIVDRQGTIIFFINYYSMISYQQVSKLVALNPDGSQKLAGPEIPGDLREPVIGLGGTFYALSNLSEHAPKLHALDAAGQPQ